MDDWVFIDSCIWASFFSKTGSAEKVAVDDLLDQGRAALIGPVVTEVLVGFRRKDHADWIASRLQAAHYIEVAWDDWRAAADLGRELASHGHNLPVPDLILASAVKRCNAWVYTTDPHFDLIPDLKRYRPPGSRK